MQVSFDLFLSWRSFFPFPLFRPPFSVTAVLPALSILASLLAIHHPFSLWAIFNLFYVQAFLYLFSTQSTHLSSRPSFIPFTSLLFFVPFPSYGVVLFLFSPGRYLLSRLPTRSFLFWPFSHLLPGNRPSTASATLQPTTSRLCRLWNIFLSSLSTSSLLSAVVKYQRCPFRPSSNRPSLLKITVILGAFHFFCWSVIYGRCHPSSFLFFHSFLAELSCLCTSHQSYILGHGRPAFSILSVLLHPCCPDSHPHCPSSLFIPIICALLHPFPS
jgi:hypothetical protein